MSGFKTMAFYTDLMFSLPEELWIFILKNVSSQDTLNVLRAYPHISEAVQPYKALLLFGKVVPFLTGWKPSKNNGLLTPSDLRSCRLVCKIWSREIDFMFETHDGNLVNTVGSWQSDLNRFNLNHNRWNSSLDIQFYNISDFTKFSEQFASLRRNPFPSRSLKISFTEIWNSEGLEVTDEIKQAANERYWTLLINFLKKFGTFIKHFSLVITFGWEKPQNYNGVVQLKNLAKCLRLLPNLKLLDLLISNRFLDQWIFNSPEELESTIASEFHSLPKIEIASFDCPDAKLLDALLNMSNSLKRVCLDPPVNHKDSQPFTMPTLLQITLFPVRNCEQVEWLNRLVLAAPQLCKVTLCYFDNSRLSLPKLIQALQAFPNRQEFKLKLGNPGILDMVRLTKA